MKRINEKFLIKKSEIKIKLKKRIKKSPVVFSQRNKMGTKRPKEESSTFFHRLIKK